MSNELHLAVDVIGRHRELLSDLIIGFSSLLMQNSLCFVNHPSASCHGITNKLCINTSRRWRKTNLLKKKAIIKLLKHKEADLTIEEKAAVESLKLPVVEVTHAVNVDEDEFASGLLKIRKLEKKNSRSEYMDPTFLLPTSDLIERFLA